MNNILKISVLLVILGLNFSCYQEEGSGDTQEEKDEVNDFIWKGMNSWYLWQENVSNLSDNKLKNSREYTRFINSNKDHTAFFYNLIYKKGIEDRFSWIVDDVDKLLAKFSGKQAATGMDFDLMLLKDGNTVIGLVNYVEKGSAAEEAGLKRGAIFVKINGERLNKDNYVSKINSEDFTITVAENYQLDKDTWDGEKTYTIHGSELQTNPVYFSKIFREGNKKIAYLVFNAFRANYNDELNEKFAEFKAAGVTDLILDLRYNGGGSVNTAMVLAQLITGQFTNQKYISLIYNHKHPEENRVFRFSKEINIYDFKDGNLEYVRKEMANSLGLKEVYFLTSKSTASASELTISALRPYIKVVQIGERTYGKFVGSITLVDDSDSSYTNVDKRNKNHNYAMQPIVFSYHNSRNDKFNHGLEPDQRIEMKEYVGTLKEFGNPSDPALAKALNLITKRENRQYFERKNKTNVEFLSSTRIMEKFGTEMYIEN